jgi:uncharacterized protein (TIRG00374 family)
MEKTMWISGGLFLVVTIGFVFFLLFPRTAFDITSWLLSPLPEQFQKKLLALLEVFMEGIQFLRHLDLLLMVIVSSAIIWLAEALFYYSAALSFGISISFVQALFIKGILNLGILLPSAPGYLGTFEFFIVETLKLMNVNPHRALGYALISHLVEFVSINLLGIYYWLKEGLRWTDIHSPEYDMNKPKI